MIDAQYAPVSRQAKQESPNEHRVDLTVSYMHASLNIWGLLVVFIYHAHQLDTMQGWSERPTNNVL